MRLRLAGPLMLCAVCPWAAAQASAHLAVEPPFVSATAITAPPTPAAPSRAGTFKHVQGDAWIGHSARRQRPAPGDGMLEAERLSTGPDGVASILLKDGTVLTVGPNTTVDLRRFQFDSTTQEGNFALDLIKGSVRVITGLLARLNPDLFKVHTPTSVVGVRGTDFIVEVGEPPAALATDPSAELAPGTSGCS